MSGRLSFGKAAANAVVNAYKQRARRKNIKWKLTKKQALSLFVNNCMICKTSPSNTMNTLRNSGTFKYNGIDRVDSNKDYTIDNVQTMCFICNRAKGDLTQNEFNNWITKLKENVK